MPKRRAARVEMNRSIEFHGSRGFSHGMVRDFSPRGCRIHQADANVHCGMQLTLRIVLPDRIEPTEIKHAAVTWTGVNDFGVEFSQSSRETQTRVKQVYDLLLQAQTSEDPDRVISLPVFTFG